MPSKPSPTDQRKPKLQQGADATSESPGASDSGSSDADRAAATDPRGPGKRTPDADMQDAEPPGRDAGRSGRR